MTSARDITATLGGQWHGNHGMCRCLVHDDRTPSLKINDSDDDADGVVVHCFAGCDWQDVKDELRAMGLLPEFEPGHHTLRQPRRSRRANTEPDPKKLANIERARVLFREAQPVTDDCHVATYLRRRGITLPIPPTIKYIPALKHPYTNLFFPTMVAAISGADKKISGVHQTFLKLDGSGKATISKPKLALGRLSGDAVRLAPATEILGIAEGIETGLSAMQLYGGAVWCACGSHIDKIALSDVVKRVRIYADSGDPGQSNAAKAADTYRRQGRDITIISPPPEYGDFNDILTTAMEVAA